MSIVSRYMFSRLLLHTMLIAVLVLGIFGCRELNANAAVSACNTVTNIDGEYQCSGKCVVTGADGRELISVSGETDTVSYFNPMSEELYQIEIVGDNGNFHETEIGPLVGRTLRTATAEVSDRHFPVLEEYIFDTDQACQAKGFTKIVRNPSKANFKSCVIYCEKSNSYRFP